MSESTTELTEKEKEKLYQDWVRAGRPQTVEDSHDRSEFWRFRCPRCELAAPAPFVPDPLAVGQEWIVEMGCNCGMCWTEKIVGPYSPTP